MIPAHGRVAPQRKSTAIISRVYARPCSVYPRFLAVSFSFASSLSLLLPSSPPPRPLYSRKRVAIAPMPRDIADAILHTIPRGSHETHVRSRSPIASCATRCLRFPRSLFARSRSSDDLARNLEATTSRKIIPRAHQLKPQQASSDFRYRDSASRTFHSCSSLSLSLSLCSGCH